jgi:MFS transporter, DHA1 family, tetracycline resistance protein
VSAGVSESSAAASRRVVPFVFATAFLDLIGFGIILPLLPFYVTSMGGSARTIGILFSCFAFTQLVATPILGKLSDRVGRRPVILLSLAGNALSMGVFALATHVRLLPLLFASRVLAGATAGNLAACQAAIADVTSEEDRAAGMGSIGAGIGLGFVLGPVLGGLLTSLGSWAPPLGAALLAVLDLGLAFVMMPETRHLGDAPSSRASTHGLREVIGHWPVLSALLLQFLLFLGIATLQVALALYVSLKFEWGAHEVALLFAAYGAELFVVQTFFIGILTRAIGETGVVVASSLAVAAGMALVAVANTPPPLVAGVGLIGIGMGSGIPVLGSIASQSAPRQNQGEVLGFMQSSGGLARTVGPLLWGELYRMSPSAPFVGGAIASLLSIAVVLARKRA